MSGSSPPHLVPDQEFPPYSYVPGYFPHPISDPMGHSFGTRPAPCVAPDPIRWWDCRPFLVGIDLFNHGYYWEAHEVWESLWNACGRKGKNAEFVKGLIKLAAAGVKVRQGQPSGVRHHARRAAELFAQVRPTLDYMGLEITQLIQFANAVTENPPAHPAGDMAAVKVVFSFILRPVDRIRS